MLILGGKVLKENNLHHIFSDKDFKLQTTSEMSYYLNRSCGTKSHLKLKMSTGLKI